MARHKEPTHSEGDLGSIPGLGRSSGGGHSNPLQYSCLENSHGQRSLVGYVHEIAKSWTQLIGYAHTHRWYTHLENSIPEPPV